VLEVEAVIMTLTPWIVRVLAAAGVGVLALAATVTSSHPPATASVPHTQAAVNVEQAACPLPARLLGKDHEVIPTTAKIVALTFDAGASADGVPTIRRVLEKRQVKATFFLTGQFAEQFPVKSGRIAGDHIIGNHTYSHPDLTTFGDLGVLRQIDRGQRAIVEVTAVNPRPYFRFPFGARDSRTIGLVNERCYVAVRWTVDTLGWMGTSGGQSVDSVVARVHNALRPGAIVLMHVGAHPTDGSTLDAQALGRVITMIRQHGYTLVTLEALTPSTP
jgi:peptidoglycan/xylan/chitin deacetylase (PgdA/CDA1 family)